MRLAALVLTLTLPLSAHAQEKPRVTADLALPAIGASLGDFRKAHPKVAFPADAATRSRVQGAQPETLFGLEGAWSYVFQGGKLVSAHWFATPCKPEDKDFARALTAARSALDSLSKTAKPFRLEQGKTDLAGARAATTSVLFAAWKTERSRFNLDFRFMRDKDDSGTFDLSVEFFGPTYDEFSLLKGRP